MRLPPGSVARRLDCIRISNDIGSCLGLFHSKQMAPDDGRSVHPARAHHEPSVLVETNLSHDSRDQNKTSMNEKELVTFVTWEECAALLWAGLSLLHAGQRKSFTRPKSSPVATTVP